MKKIFLKDGFLNKLNSAVKGKVGENIYFILGVMSVLLVFCGLVIGLLGRGWFGAWTLVAIGLILGFFPVIDALIRMLERQQANIDADDVEMSQIVQEALSHKRFSGEKKESVIDDIRQRQEEEREAIALQALLAQERARRREAEKKKRQEEEEKLEQMRKAMKEEEERKRAEEKKKEEERIRLKRKILEEERRKRSRSTQNVFKGGTVRNYSSGPEFFGGVKSLSELRKRYRELIKKYHPDNGAGDPEVMRKVQAEYEELRRFFESYGKH